MKVLLALVTLLAISGFFLFNSSEQQSLQASPETEILKAFQQWKSQHGQNFNGSEEEYRYQEFKNNYLFVQQHNAQDSSLTLGLTQFAAMSNAEFRLQTLLSKKPTAHSALTATKFQKTGADLPKSVDWVSAGAVYQTQNQGSCGSCWSFATIGGLQGLRYIVDGVLELLSAQQITSCVAAEFLDDKTQGCGGGEAQYAYAYTAENGIETDAAYPYVNGAGGVAKPCAYDAKKVVFTNKGVGFVEHNDVQAMKEALVNQPLSIAVDAGSIYFQLYSEGVIKSPNCGTDLNHAILLVGYQEDAAEPYWTVQNSWGTGWGSNGFGNIIISEGDGVCGINMQVDYPTSVDQPKTH